MADIQHNTGPNESAAAYRHAVENLVYRYAELADDRDAAGLGQLLAAATLTFPGAPDRHGADAITAHFQHAYADAPPSRHLVTNVIVEAPVELVVAARCRYTRWLLHDPAELVALGEYHATISFREDPHGALTVLTVTRSWSR